MVFKGLEEKKKKMDESMKAEILKRRGLIKEDVGQMVEMVMKKPKTGWEDEAENDEDEFANAKKLFEPQTVVDQTGKVVTEAEMNSGLYNNVSEV